MRPHRQQVIAEAGGRHDVLALGEWIHGGDVRGALGEPLAYESDGFEDACALLAEWTRRLKIPLVEVTLAGAALRLGVPVPGRPAATLVTGPATLMRLFAGRPTEPASRRFHLPTRSGQEAVGFHRETQ